jgi:hypothetical protein
MKKKEKQDEILYYVNPKAVPEPEAKVYCANSMCNNFIPIHQTCNLKNLFINIKGRCEFSVKKKIKAYEKQTTSKA